MPLGEAFFSKPASTPSKRQRFSTGAITTSTPARPHDLGDGSELVATIRRWGSTFGVFDDGSRTEPLWQLQVTHGGPQSFGYQPHGVCREALQEYPNKNIRNLTQLETEIHVKILHGAPPDTFSIAITITSASTSTRTSTSTTRTVARTMAQKRQQPEAWRPRPPIGAGG